MKPVEVLQLNIFTDRPKEVLLLWIVCVIVSCVCDASTSVYCCLLVTCWERADLLALVYGVILCFYYFPIWYPGSCVVLDRIDS